MMKRAFFALIALAALTMAGCTTYDVATSEGYHSYTHEDTYSDPSPSSY